MTLSMARRAASLLTVWVAGSVMACGGSSSETPWPVEPDGVNLGTDDEHKDRELAKPPPEASPEPAPESQPEEPPPPEPAAP